MEYILIKEKFTVQKVDRKPEKRLLIKLGFLNLAQIKGCGQFSLISVCEGNNRTERKTF